MQQTNAPDIVITSYPDIRQVRSQLNAMSLGGHYLRPQLNAFMTRIPRNHSNVVEHVAFAGELSRWIERAGVTDSEAIGDLAVGFADILNASASASRVLEELIALDPNESVGAEAALTKLGYLHALFITEIKAHAEDLERRWDTLEECLGARVPVDGEEDE